MVAVSTTFSPEYLSVYVSAKDKGIPLELQFYHPEKIPRIPSFMRVSP